MLARAWHWRCTPRSSHSLRRISLLPSQANQSQPFTSSYPGPRVPAEPPELSTILPAMAKQRPDQLGADGIWKRLVAEMLLPFSWVIKAEQLPIEDSLCPSLDITRQRCTPSELKSQPALSESCGGR